MSGEVQQVKCPVCGAPGVPGDFCEMGCGRLPGPAAAESAPTRESSADGRSASADDGKWWAPRPAPGGGRDAPPRPAPAPAPARPAGPGAAGPAADLKLEYDALCVFFERVQGVLRFRITAGRRLEGVTLEMKNSLTGDKLPPSRRLSAIEPGTMREIGISVPGQEAGAVVWYLTVAYEVDGRKRSLEGEATLLSLKPREAQKAAENLSVTINNNITNGNASDVSLSQHAADDLQHLAQADNPYEELRKIVQGGQRAWTQMSLDRAGTLEALPPMPDGAAANRLTLELDGGLLHLRVGRTVTVGRSRSGCEIILRPRPDAKGGDRDRYLAISRRHCHFEARGKQILVEDGYREGMSGVKPSSFGTFWNNGRINGAILLNAGDTGMLSLGGESAGADGTSFKAKACPPCGKCAVCTKTDRSWCGDGQHACLLLNRQGGRPEAYVALWGCFGLGEADPAFEGITLFRERGGFAWRRGRHCGWLVPGTVMQTEFGTLRVRGEEAG